MDFCKKSIPYNNSMRPRRNEQLRLDILQSVAKTDLENSNLVAVDVHLSATRGAWMVQHNIYGIHMDGACLQHSFW